MTIIFHHMIDTDYYHYSKSGLTVNYAEPIDSIDCIHFVREPGKMNNRHESLLLLGVF